MKLAVLFIGQNKYLSFFTRFYNSAHKFLCPGTPKQFFVFTENILNQDYTDVALVKVPYRNKRDCKIHKFHSIKNVTSQLQSFDYVLYFDADSYFNDIVDIDTVNAWFNKNSYVSVMHPWNHIRQKDRRFEKNPQSTAFIPPDKWGDFPYHQSCFWGTTGKNIAHMVDTISEWINEDINNGHVNEYGICDEIYVNRYLFDNRMGLTSVDTEYANPGDAYKKTNGYSFNYKQIISHDNSNQTKTHMEQKKSSADIKIGAFFQMKEWSRQAQKSLQMFRRHYPIEKISICGDGGMDLQSMVLPFNCSYTHYSNNIGTWKHRHENTNQYHWLERIYNECKNNLQDIDWVLLLEPDVETFHRHSHIPEYTLNGPSNGPNWSPEIREFLEHRHASKIKFTNRLGKSYTGCGGSVFNRQIFIECFENTSMNTFSDAHILDSRITLAEDATLSYLFQYNGYDTGIWEDLTGYLINGKVNDRRHTYAFCHGNKKMV